MLLFLFLAALILAQHTIHVLLVEQQLAHLVTGGAVFGIRRLFFGKQLGIFLLQALDGIVSYIRLRRKLSVVVPLRDNIFIADDIKSPFVVGLFRPKIYLPCNLGDKEQEYIILHEQHHIKRLDHVMKALAFLALAIHWFNPLVWVAFILASKDMEMSCDEAVIRKIGGDVRADYSASLLTLATGRRIIAGTPLAFGEGDTKGRINNLSKWKKPAVWVVLVAVVACVVLAVCLLTNPSQTRDTMKWAQSLSVEDVASADLVVYPQAADKQFKQLSAEELSEMVALINESKGKYRIEHEELAGGGISFYITMKDGTSHSVENIGNTYLVIDGEYYEASYNWLNGWSKRFGEGNTRIPDQYFSVPLTLDEVLELSQRGHELIWGDFNSYKYYETGSGLYIRVYEIDDDFSLWIGGSGPEYELEPMYIYLALKDDIDTHIDIRDGNVAEFIGQHRSVAADHEGTSTLRTGDLIPGTTYVSYQCLYMNPLSSYAAMGGDSGCKYIIGEDYFATINRNDGSFVSVTNPNMDIATSGLDGLQNMIEVSNWEWKEFPYPDKDSICIVDTPTGYEFYVCTWLNVQNDDIDNSDNVLATYGLPESFEKMEILSKDFTYLFTVEDASVTEAIFEILSGKSNIGLEANERHFAQAWYDAYGNDDVYYSEEAGHCVYRSVSSDEEPTTYTDDEGNTVVQNSTQDTSLYDKAHELWTKGERLIEITTTKGYQLTIDYFPSIQVFICSNGYYELSAADIETLSQLLQITD